MRISALALLCLISVSLAAATPAELAAAGKAALERRDDQKAAELFEQAVKLAPNNAEYHYNLGSAYGRLAQKANVLKQAGLAKKTRNAFQRAAELDPNYLEPRLALIDYYLMAPGFMGGGEDKAIAMVAEIKKRDAVEGHRAQARVYTRQKKTDLARKEFVDAVRENPTSARAHYLLGTFLMNEKNWTGSLQEIEAAIKLNDKYMPAYNRLGQHAALSGTNPARGEEALRKYLAYKPAENEPAHGSTWYWLGTLQEKQGRKADAKQSFTNALKLAPESKEIKEALKRVS